MYCRQIVWVPPQLVAYMATFGTQFLSLKFHHCQLFMQFVMLKQINEMKVEIKN